MQLMGKLVRWGLELLGGCALVALGLGLLLAKLDPAVAMAREDDDVPTP